MCACPFGLLWCAECECGEALSITPACLASSCQDSMPACPREWPSASVPQPLDTRCVAAASANEKTQREEERGKNNWFSLWKLATGRMRFEKMKFFQSLHFLLFLPSTSFLSCAPLPDAQCCLSLYSYPSPISVLPLSSLKILGRLSLASLASLDFFLHY